MIVHPVLTGNGAVLDSLLFWKILLGHLTISIAESFHLSLKMHVSMFPMSECPASFVVDNAEDINRFQLKGK
jgi:hypothetical protein